ncbi:MAG: hypothetical protein QM724_05625 [Flavobacteriales bacterium]
MVRILLVLAEVDYTDPDSIPDPVEATGTTNWPAHQLPTWVDNVDPTRNLFDWDVPVGTASGAFTRYYQEASSGHLIVLADYLRAPTNGGIFQVPSSTGKMDPEDVIAVVNAALGTTLVTGHGHNSTDDFDKWTIGSSTSGPGQPKATPSTENPRKFDHVMFIWRNSQGNDGTGYAMPGSSATLLGRGINTYSQFGAYNHLPLKIARHEFAHLLYGDNNFHTAGGGWPENKRSNGTWSNEYGQYWITQSSGWSNLGLYNCSLPQLERVGPPAHGVEGGGPDLRDLGPQHVGHGKERRPGRHGGGRHRPLRAAGLRAER